ncbi:MAG: hypothetical protein AVDCRST_MAG93-8744 [uncultured Chloroflexia bacterium]|uniref:Uncharacterized protein n=1 Tax=uncultured Chloroflexia bacterium TaxID=1672391 RepID=A0A6J4N209_9CHLR|nr:MAG: hypothetical protein AVDCRST_MAG93-8744 [uncultured Chloroflexia bacterium]
MYHPERAPFGHKDLPHVEKIPRPKGHPRLGMTNLEALDALGADFAKNPLSPT